MKVKPSVLWKVTIRRLDRVRALTELEPSYLEEDEVFVVASCMDSARHKTNDMLKEHPDMDYYDWDVHDITRMGIILF